MPRRKLTDATVKNAKPPAKGRLEIFDALVPGLALRITDKGARSWSLMYRVGPKGQRRQRRLTLGNAKVMMLPEARAAAREALQLAAKGTDPAEAKEQSGENDQRTFAALAELYLARQRKNTRPSTHTEAKRIIDRDLCPALGNRPITSITRADVDAVIDVVENRGATTQVNRVQRAVRAVFNFAVDQEWLSSSPLARMKRRLKERARDRVLADDEIRWFWKGCDKLGWPFGPLFQLLLLSAQRRAEVANLEWRELDLTKRTWLIPRERTKSDRAHEVALSALAVEILSSLPRTSPQYVFSLSGHPVCGFNKGKKRLEQHMDALRRKELGLPEHAAPIENWSLHDLRRSATTHMAERLKIGPHIVDKILNHNSGTIRGVAATYNRAELLDERRAALEAFGRYIASLVKPPESNVIALRPGPSAA